jgi:hypothetical protein
MRLLAQKLSQKESNLIQIRKNEQPMKIAKSAIDPATEPRINRDVRAILRRRLVEIRNLGVLPDSCQLFKGGTTGFHHDAARNFAGRELHTSARGFGRS